jgi:hypothetical protein
MNKEAVPNPKPAAAWIHHVFPWIAAFMCAADGVGFFYLLSLDPENRPPAKHMYPFVSRLVYSIGPVGWLLLSLAAVSLIIRFRKSNLGALIALGFGSVVIAAMCALWFARTEIPFTTIALNP